MTENIILKAENLTKKFGKFTAVQDISFNLKEGEILGFLGPNGAGKTTTIQMLLNILKPTSGEISYFGKNLFKNREEILENINFSSTYTNLPWYTTVEENLKCFTYMYDIKNRKERLNKILEIFKLEKIAKKYISDLSAGQVTRVNLAKAFINFPKVLLLDEPTASLDPDVALYIREFLQKERQKFNVSIMITSHNMSEVEELCDRVIFINNGMIIADEAPEKLAKTIEYSHIELLIEKNIEKIKKFCETRNLKYTQIPKKKFITIDVREKEIAKTLQDMGDKGITYEEISINKPTLEDYFLQMSKRKER